jgi:hypothetical protein
MNNTQYTEQMVSKIRGNRPMAKIGRFALQIATTAIVGYAVSNSDCRNDAYQQVNTHGTQIVEHYRPQAEKAGHQVYESATTNGVEIIKQGRESLERIVDDHVLE